MSSSTREMLRNTLKFLLLFKKKSLLPLPLYLLLKESVLCGKDNEVLSIFANYDLNLLSEPKNLKSLQQLFDILYCHAIGMARKQLDGLFNEENLMVGHQISNQSAISNSKKIEDSDNRGLVYGEVEFESFQSVIEIALTGLPNKNGKFTDLGHGTGKACLWVALTTSFQDIVGIEILDGLYEKSENVLKQFFINNNINIAEKIDATTKTTKAIEPFPMQYTNGNKIQFIHGSFLEDEYDWSDSDVVFANSTCFPDELMMKLSVRSQLMAPGSRFITFTVSLDSPYWKVIYKERYKMSWGFATVYIHERLTDVEAIRIMRDDGVGAGEGSNDMVNRVENNDSIWLS